MNERTCEVCGTPLSGRATRYCSRTCGIKGNTIARAADPERMARHYASAAHWQRENREKARGYVASRVETRTCEWCGKTWQTRQDTPSRFCSSACASYTEGARCHVKWRTCAKCGEQHTQHAHHHGPTSRVPWVTCHDCGAAFVCRDGGYPACPTCAERRMHEHKRRGHGWIGRMRRIALYERDNWTCLICGEPIDRGVEPGTAWAPSLDHITPRSKGGTHHDHNLRTAHMWCNAVVNDGTYYTDADLRLETA